MSTYFDRIEDHLLDAVERRPASGPTARSRTMRRPARTRVAVATAAGVAAIVALAVAGLLAAVGGHSPDRAALDRPETLDEALAVLRRDQRPGDAPPTVVFAATAAAQTAPAPYRGLVDTGGVRRLVAGGEESGGLRLYLAPVRAPGSAPPQAPGRAVGGAQAALVVLTDADDRPVQQPYGVTVSSLREDRAWYLAYGLRAESGPRATSASEAAGAPKGDRVRKVPDEVLRLMRMRSLQIQIVPDDVATVAYRYPAEQVGRGRLTATTIEATVTGNAAVTILRGSTANRHPAEATMRDGRGDLVGRARPHVRGRGPLAPEAVCRGVEPPARPSGRPVIAMNGTTVHAVCRQAGVPQDAYRRDAGHLLLLYPDGTVLGTAGDRVSAVWHLEPGGEFPPRFTDVLAPAKKLGRHPAATRP